MKRVYILGFFTFILIGIFPMALTAQLNNKPFSFKGTPNGGIGMSIGGQQAIITKKLTGITAENLVRSSGGILLNVTEGPGKSAIVSFQGGQIIPTFKGSSWKGSNSDLSVGVFNTYFSTNHDSSAIRSPVFLDSSATIHTWTSRVATGGYPTSYSPDSSVDAWTGMAY